jgi:molecular chaperone GrpE
MANRDDGVTGPDAEAPIGGPESNEERIRALEAALEAAREDAKQSQDRWMRERADLENLKRRTTREKADLAKFASEGVLRDLLPVVDNLERAVAHAEGADDSLLSGVKMVLKSLQDALERHGVKRVRARGALFDPAEHEAVGHVESAVHEPNAVVDEHQAGYKLHDRLLRPAMVTVAKAPSPDDDLAKVPRRT